MNNQTLEILRVQLKVTYLGLALNTIAPIAAFIVIYLLSSQGYVAAGGFDFYDNTPLLILFFVLLAVSLADFGLIIYFRKKLPGRLLDVPGPSVEEKFRQSAARISTVIYLLNLSHTAYGILLLILGAPSEAAMLFIALTLVGYQIFRPRRKFLEKLYEHIEKSPLSGTGI